MPEPTAVVPAPASDPTKPGSQTSEHGIAKLVAILGSAISLVLVFLPVLIDALSKAQAAFPAAGWLGVGLGIAGTMLGVAQTASKYIGGRSDQKVAQIDGAASVQAAQATAGAGPK